MSASSWLLVDILRSPSVLFAALAALVLVLLRIILSRIEADYVGRIAANYGVTRRPGESLAQLKSRILEAMRVG